MQPGQQPVHLFLDGIFPASQYNPDLGKAQPGCKTQAQEILFVVLEPMDQRAQIFPFFILDYLSQWVWT